MPTQAELLSFFENVEGLVWGWPTLILLVITGVYLTGLLRGLQFRLLVPSLKLAFFSRNDHQGAGDISHFQALMTALAATVGTGNIAGVATAISFGGPGAVVWMWLTGFMGMATKYTEGVLGVYFRRRNSFGEMNGGPMYYIEDGLAAYPLLAKLKINKLLAVAFAAIMMVSALSLGNMVQSNSVADVLSSSFGVNTLLTGVVLAVLTGAVILGGIKRIGTVASGLVPLMILLYVGGGTAVLIANFHALPDAFRLIFDGAFNGTDAVAGGFLGAVVKEVMKYGLSRGIFSNESGLGSSPIAAACAKTRHPVEQALVSMTQTFIDTIVVCTFTALILVVTGMWATANPHEITGAALTAKAFGSVLNISGGLPLGEILVTISLVFFAYSTLLGWCCYGEKAVAYLFGDKAINPYRMVFIVVVALGAVTQLKLAWTIASVLTALMMLPNLIGLLLLSPLVARLTKDYFNNEETGEGYAIKPFHHLYEEQLTVNK
ncbi:MAG: amino acid carrier protein [Proteobacteria bacterium]|nr:amino acid carrier protein [Pseudomonadota bacterium]